MDARIRKLHREWATSGLEEDYAIYYNACLRANMMPQCYWCDQQASVRCWSCKKYLSENCATLCECESYACPDHQISCSSKISEHCLTTLCGNSDIHLTTDPEYLHLCTGCNAVLCENCTLYCEYCAEAGLGIFAEICNECAVTCFVCDNTFHNLTCLDGHPCIDD